MKVLVCLAALLGVTLASTDTSTVAYGQTPHTGYGYQPHVFGFPGSDPRCREDGDIVMDPVNRCQVYVCVMKEKKHGYDDKNVYKYFDVEKFMCPYKTIKAHIHSDGYQPTAYHGSNQVTGYAAPADSAQAGYGTHQTVYAAPHSAQAGYGTHQTGYAAPHTAQAGYATHQVGYATHQTGYATHQTGYAAPHAARPHGYGYPSYHELEVQTAVDKYTHANYLGTRVKGEAKALCNVNVHKPSEQCSDVHGY